MTEIQSLLIGTGSSTAEVPKVRSFDDGLGANRINVEMPIPMKNTSGGVLDLALGHMKSALACICTSWNFGWGQQSAYREVVDSALSYAQLRYLLIKLTDDDVLINDKRQGDYAADTDVISAATANNSTTTVKCTVPRSFEVSRLGREARIFAVGSAQVRQTWLQVKRGGDANFDTYGPNKFSQDGNFTATIEADTVEHHDQRYSFVPRLIITKDGDAQYGKGPQEESMLFATFEDTKTGTQTRAVAAGTFGFFSLKRAKDRPLMDNAKAERVDRNLAFEAMPNQVPVVGLFTSLFDLNYPTDLSQVPTGAGWVLVFPGKEIASPQTYWCYVPAKSPAMMAAAAMVLHLEGFSDVNLISSQEIEGKSVPAGVASCLPVIAATPDSTHYHSKAGWPAKNGKLAEKVYIPPHITAGIAAAAKAAEHKSKDAAEAVAREASKRLAKSVPGGSSAVRGLGSDVKSEIKGYIGKSAGQRLRNSKG